MARGRIVCSDMLSLFTLSLIGPSGPHWGEYKETKVCHSDLAFDETFILVQQLLELNSNTMDMISDIYRASSIDLIANMSDMFSG
jgi:hypothetical protein